MTQGGVVIKIFALVAFLLQFSLTGMANACDMEKPKGEVILSVEGMINGCNESMSVKFDRAMIEALPRHVIKTENPWDQGMTSYEGVLLRELMKYVKADGNSVTFVALNDYRSEIPMADIEKYDVILAYSRNGTELSVREKGPFFVVFPFSDEPDLNTEARFAQSVWQVTRIEVK